MQTNYNPRTAFDCHAVPQDLTEKEWIEELQRIALHEAGHAVMAREMGLIVTDISLSKDPPGPLCAYVWPLCRYPHDREYLKVTLAGPAVSILTGDPQALSASRGDLKAAQQVVSKHLTDEEPLNVVLGLLDDVTRQIRNHPTFMSRVNELAQFLLHEPHHQMPIIGAVSGRFYPVTS
jgi:predicted nucleic acid-binding protein